MIPEFHREISQIEEQIRTAQNLGSVNSRLMGYNWIFLHPYSQGMDIGILRRLLDEEDAEIKIFNFFAEKFLNLRVTIHFIEGFYKRRPFLKDFGVAIEESVVLCLQKDFRGAICVLIPVIEGTLRKFLVSQVGDAKKATVGSGMLTESIRSMTDAYVELSKTYLRKKYAHLWNSGRYFSDAEEGEILDKDREFFQLWIGQLERYLTQNLYHDTRKSEPTDLFNRHLIYHALNDSVEFSFANYLRLYNCIHYMSWAIGSTTYESSPFSEAREEEVFIKYKDYLKILVASEALTSTKERILGKPVESYKAYLHPLYVAVIQRPKSGIVEVLQIIDSIRYESHDAEIILSSRIHKAQLPKWFVKLTGFLRLFACGNKKT